MNEFFDFLRFENKSKNTIKAYTLYIQAYKKWYEQSFSLPCEMLYRENILDYISYIRNVKKFAAKTINGIISSLMKYNQFLITEEVQKEIVVFSKDKIKIQESYANPSTVSKEEVEAFKQKILINEGKRDYCLVNLLAYTGVRISGALNIKMSDFDLCTKEMIVREKGNKERVVYLNDKVINSIREYLKIRNSSSEYLFISRQSDRINKSTINRIFNKYSNKITPHTLRHYFCSRAIESGMSIHQVASIAGHKNINTTLLYTNPSKEEMKQKVNLL